MLPTYLALKANLSRVLARASVAQRGCESIPVDIFHGLSFDFHFSIASKSLLVIKAPRFLHVIRDRQCGNFSSRLPTPRHYLDHIASTQKIDHSPPYKPIPPPLNLPTRRPNTQTALYSAKKNYYSPPQKPIPSPLATATRRPTFRP
jgi:hypothetical protein